jgi:hypothetical protein
MVIGNVNKYLQGCTASHPRRHYEIINFFSVVTKHRTMKRCDGVKIHLHAFLKDNFIFHCFLHVFLFWTSPFPIFSSDAQRHGNSQHGESTENYNFELPC